MSLMTSLRAARVAKARMAALLAIAATIALAGLTLLATSSVAQARDTVPPTTPKGLVAKEHGAAKATAKRSAGCAVRKHRKHARKHHKRAGKRHTAARTHHKRARTARTDQKHHKRAGKRHRKHAAHCKRAHRAQNDNGIAHRHDHTAPTAPTNLTAAGGAHQVALAWSQSTDNIGVAGYDVYSSGVEIGSAATAADTVAGLPCGTTYQFTVDAYDDAGNHSPQSAAVNVATTACTDGSAPSSPSGLQGSNISGTGLNLAWAPSTDNVGVKGYDVFKGGTAIAQTSGTNATVSGLSCATTYSFAVDAFDAAGNHSPQSAPLSVTTSTCSTPTPPPTPGADPSGEAMPTGDIAGWHQIFADDFAQSVPLGSFPSQVSGKWGAYPYPWSGTPTWATYYPEKTTSVANGLMDIWMHSENIGGSVKYLISAPYPKIGTSDNNQLYGRYAIRFKTDQFRQYHASWLLWPKSEQWPQDGEIDFPEGDFDSNIGAFMHQQNGTSGGDQDAYNTSTPMYGAWHTAVIEWLPTRCTFIIDGKVIGQSTSRIPNTPMHWVIQNGGSFGVSNPDPNVQGHVYIDWVAVYRPA
jgi:chitodextrinase